MSTEQKYFDKITSLPQITTEAKIIYSLPPARQPKNKETVENMERREKMRTNFIEEYAECKKFGALGK